jgi:hypothetical protein
VARPTVRVLPEVIVHGQRLGRHVEHDPRSWKYRVRGTSRPARIVRPLRPRLWKRYSPILNQGNRSSCTGNAMAGCLGCEPFVTSAQAAARFNESMALDLYSAATRLDRISGEYPPDDTGSTGLAVAKAAQQAGLIGPYRHAFSAVALVRALQAGPVIVGVPWYEGFDNPSSGGLVVPTGQVRGGHEFLIRGWQPARKFTDGTFWADQSWGLPWGNNGSFTFSLGTWEKLADEQADVTVPLPLAA